MSTSDHKLNRVAVFCGANAGTRPEYLQSANDVGQELVKRKIGLVYGGGSVGMMGAVAQIVDSGLGEGGVIGVIPHDLMPREMSGAPIGDLRVVDTMHQRKAQMSDLSDAFMALPGGFGTLEELLEIVTWNQIGLIVKPVGILNVAGYFDHLLKFFDHAVQEGFVREASRTIVIEGRTPAELLDKLAAYKPPPSLLELAKTAPPGLR
ncbi:hypothetical protein WJX79_002825 [Trebouxia sp. C0005]|nr:MAG: cytokinin riboside 5 -monophosphate phosphoribohydrolase LOG7-like [Trebouxia sp. A1-2]